MCAGIRKMAHRKKRTAGSRQCDVFFRNIRLLSGCSAPHILLYFNKKLQICKEKDCDEKKGERKRAGTELLDISGKADYHTNHDKITGKRKDKVCLILLCFLSQWFR